MLVKEQRLREKRLFLLDIDGTVWRGNQLIEGAENLLHAINKSGGTFVFITNNATRSIKDYREKFRELGIETKDSNFVTASYVTVQYLKEHYEGRTIYVMGTDSFIDELQRNDIYVTADAHNEDIACVLVSYDDQLTYKKLEDVCELLSTKEVDYIGTNPDYSCPTSFGYVPDCGAICEMIGHSVKKKPYFIGKPQTAIVEAAIELTRFSKEQALLVGDRLYTDILCGKRAGVDTALVLTGEATIEELEKTQCQPDFIFESVEELHQVWRQFLFE